MIAAGDQRPVAVGMTADEPLNTLIFSSADATPPDRTDAATNLQVASAACTPSTLTYRLELPGLDDPECASRRRVFHLPTPHPMQTGCREPKQPSETAGETSGGQERTALERFCLKVQHISRARARKYAGLLADLLGKEGELSVGNGAARVGGRGSARGRGRA